MQKNKTLEELERYIREFLLFLPFPVCTVNPLGMITDVDRAFSELTHYKDAEIIGERIGILFKNKEKWEHLEKRILRKEIIEREELILERKDKKKVPVSIYASFRDDEDGNLIGYFVALADITEFKELQQTLEEKVRVRTKELQERVEELERFHKLAVGRELKMVALKKELQEAKEEIEKVKGRQ